MNGNFPPEPQPELFAPGALAFFPTADGGENRPARFSTGVLPAQMLRELIDKGGISSDTPLTAAQLQPASLDLRLGGRAWSLPASFLPGSGSLVTQTLKRIGAQEIDFDGETVLRRRHVYLVALQEKLALPKRFSGTANPKSSLGRLDVFCRLITDCGVEFDRVPERYKGPLWLEIAPRSFDILVRPGDCLTQLRIRRGAPNSSETLLRSNPLLAEQEQADIKNAAVALSVDLRGEQANRPQPVGYRAKRQTPAPVDIHRIGHYRIREYWEPIFRPENGRIILQPDEFHILASKERVVIPNFLAAEMIAYDTVVGEFRVHYAGFFDPGFGLPAGAQIVLEVRSHEVAFMLEHGQTVGRVFAEPLLQATDRPYGAGIGSSYQGQGLKLGKQFATE